MKTECEELQKNLVILNKYANFFPENVSEMMYIEENSPKIAGIELLSVRNLSDERL